jgi:HSP20 family protein
MAGKDIATKNETGKALAERREWMHPFDSFRQEMNRLMDSFFQGSGIRPFDTRVEGFSPRVDIVDTGKAVDVSVELPGMDDKDIEVSLTEGALTIKGEKKEEKEEKGKDYYRCERSFGSFTRTVPVPEGIEAEGVAASFKKGVLTVRMPKTKQAVKDAKKIAVKAE